jgi:dihydroorotate dehydrogenase
MGSNFNTIGNWLTACLRILPPEFAHDLAIFSLERGALNLLPPPIQKPWSVPLNVDLPGVGRLKHPIGLAAGFDKNARCPLAFERMGLSFLELGTVTPQPQPGNPKPRLFRQPEVMAIINRMGFNSEGAQKVLRRLEQLPSSTAHVPMGINVGKNKNTPAKNAIDDYVAGIKTFHSRSRWLTINLSSPNTPGLRDLATPGFLRDLANACAELTSKCWIKLDPDMDRRTFQSLIQAIKTEGFQGAVLSNTHRVEWPHQGGQSGHPLLSPSNSCLDWTWDVTRGALPVIASGGVLSGVDAFHKLARGARAVQIYTALVYRGPGAALQICEELAAELKLRGFASVEEAIGSWYL